MSCILTLYTMCIMFIALFIDQHLCIILCILDDITNYFSNAFRCSLTSSSGSPVQLRVLWNTSNDHKHLLVARYKIALFLHRIHNS
jgi:hypothetical protein